MGMFVISDLMYNKKYGGLRTFNHKKGECVERTRKVHQQTSQEMEENDVSSLQNSRDRERQTAHRQIDAYCIERRWSTI